MCLSIYRRSIKTLKKTKLAEYSVHAYGLIIQKIQYKDQKINKKSEGSRVTGTYSVIRLGEEGGGDKKAREDFFAAPPPRARGYKQVECCRGNALMSSPEYAPVEWKKKEERRRSGSFQFQNGSETRKSSSPHTQSRKKGMSYHLNQGTQIRWYCMSKKQLPILYSNLLYEMGNYFLDTQ